ncbi:uncharacterized protein LOC130357893 [Hyla sarda]|uniref:uncharacterized protein LOC130357893 n=1 Tax=Hyla sarda TaxID=327740 RepID=UPI0024C239A7|nr:uncharacterized protein LOC130357893 [Hyla sarda]
MVFFYLQKIGASMGAKSSPALANLFVFWWENFFIFSEHNPYRDNIAWFGRYVDDVIVIWKNNESSANVFMSYLNDNHCNLRFTHTWSKTCTPFLDVLLVDNGDSIEVRPFRKAISGNTLLRADSCHPEHTIKGVPVGKLIRGKRNSSEESVYQAEANAMCTRFRQRGYPNWILDKARKRVDVIQRSDLLTNKEHTQPGELRQRLVA